MAPNKITFYTESPLAYFFPHRKKVRRIQILLSVLVFLGIALFSYVLFSFRSNLVGAAPCGRPQHREDLPSPRADSTHE